MQPFQVFVHVTSQGGDLYDDTTATFWFPEHRGNFLMPFLAGFTYAFYRMQRMKNMEISFYLFKTFQAFIYLRHFTLIPPLESITNMKA